MTTQNIVKYTETRIGNNSQLQQFIQEAKNVANVIFPETLPFNDRYTRLGCEVVTVDPENTKHVYKNESGSYCLHLSKLNEIAKAAKIRVVDSKILERRVDETGRVTFISHQVTVQYRTVSGEMITESYNGKYDYYNDLATKTEANTKQRRKHAEALAESNALTRAFTKVIPQLPSSFSKSDFGKPFLIPYVEEDKDALLEEFSPEERAEIKKDLARRKLGIGSQLFGSQPTQQGVTPTPKTGAPAAGAPAADTVDATVVEESTGSDDQPTPAERAEAWRNEKQESRTNEIMRLIEVKGWKHPKGYAVTAAMVNKSSLDKQVSRLEELYSMPDMQEEETL